MSSFHSRLEQLKNLFKRGRFNKQTLTLAEELNDLANQNEGLLRAEEEHSLLKCRCLVSETFERFGRTKEARRASREGYGFIKQMIGDPTLFANKVHRTREDKLVLRERVRMCLDYVQTTFYRTHNYAAAKKILAGCLRFVENSLQDEEFKCYGTKAAIYWQYAKVLRQDGDFVGAERAISLSMKYYHLRALRKLNSTTDREAHALEMAYATNRTGVALALGLGWINFARGRLSEALHSNIIPARVLLLHAEDELNNAYLDLIHASIIRSLSKRGDASLKTAAAIAEKSYSAFRGNGHRRYMARAAFELGLIQLHMGNLKEAEERAREVQTISEEAVDRRWVCNSLIFRSRIELRRHVNSVSGKRERPEAAERLALEAFQIADKHDQVLCKCKCLVALAEARIEAGDLALARENLRAALALNELFSPHTKALRDREGDGTHCYLDTLPWDDSEELFVPTPAPTISGRLGHANPKLEAICLLNLARSHARAHEARLADEYFARWKDLAGAVEHQHVQDLADAVNEEIQALKADFIIPASEGTELSYEKHEWSLRRFLIRQARERGLTNQQIADELGISRQTLYIWEKYLAEREGDFPGADG